jgi:formyltetrahydrofolate deformylase
LPRPAWNSDLDDWYPSIFLPGFESAKPCHPPARREDDRHDRHCVVAKLVEGAIIVLDVEQAIEADTPENLVRWGRDIKWRVLARAVLFHLQDRVILNGAKTVVFTD